MSIERTDLASGLTVVSESIPGARSASFGCWVRIGGRDETDELAGASHFLEHLLFKGTETRSSQELSEAIEAVGGELNAHTAHEHTAFYTRVPGSIAAVGLDLLVDVVSGPVFDDDDVESERQVILEELNQAEDEGEDRVHTLAHEALWGTHPLGREVLGSLATIDGLQRDEIAGFFDRHYSATNLVLVAAGAVDHATLVDAGARLPTRPTAVRPHRTAPDLARPAHERLLIRRPLEQAHLAMAWPGLAADDPDRYALGIANQIFGGGLSSRLFQLVREQRGLAYSVYSSVAAYHDAGSVVAYAGTGAERVADVRKVIAETAATLAADGVTEREWEVARGYLEGASLLALEDSGSVMGRLGNHVCARGTVAPVETQLEKLRAVTPEDVGRAARRVFGADPAVCGVGPVTEEDLGA